MTRIRSPRALSLNPWFGVKGLGDNIASSAIFLSSSVLQRIFWKGGSAVYCLPVGSRGEYCCRIFSVSPVSLPASLVTWAEPWLCCFLYLGWVCWVWIFIFTDVAMGSKWSSSMESTRPPDESTRFVLVGARRVFASSTNTCYLSGRHPYSSHRSHPGCLDRELMEAVSEAFSGGNCGCLPHDVFWSDGIVFVAKHIREKNRCKKRICDVLDHPYVLTTSLFLPECIWVIPLWE